MEQKVLTKEFKCDLDGQVFITRVVTTIRWVVTTPSVMRSEASLRLFTHKVEVFVNEKRVFTMIL
jgi:hypothetical protein